ncbi:MAG TPA: flagellar motor protein MotB [Edaphobacter sp.]|uniref:flagellar motor protein MotB n=1 Tax=Edaphobacter sp. TaxID=1934404 RepID=UPI002C29FFF9|nr:flagellar motor protein MotB [Edaphobacter sp.]HUZ94123.1 flagellar motor protein MotB [Edaphobacter sp.]
MQATHPIVIVKKKHARSSHHGGAWKVAYADFVTALMALFIVLWLMNASRQVQEAVGGYFKDPRGTSKRVGTNRSGSDVYVPIRKEDMIKLKEDLLESIHHLDPHNKFKHQIEITVTAEGLRIELIESPKGTFFQLGSATPTAALRDLLRALSVELGKLPNKISVEGHTDSMAYVRRGYDNWDLSTDRANEARRLMVAEGVRPDQVVQVRGFADREPRAGLKPADPLNRRVTLIVQYQVENASEQALPSSITSQDASPPSNSPLLVPAGQGPGRAGR